MNELSSQLRSRYYFCQELIHRPFLYCMILDITNSPQMVEHAHKCLEYASIIIKVVAHPHRFGGIWFNMRRSFSSALLLLAAVGDAKLTLPIDWQSSITLCLQTLAIWEVEASDLRWCRQILEGILNGVVCNPATELPSIFSNN